MTGEEDRRRMPSLPGASRLTGEGRRDRTSRGKGRSNKAADRERDALKRAPTRESEDGDVKSPPQSEDCDVKSPLLSGERGHHGVFVVVGMLPRTAIGEDPDDGVPNENVDEQIAREGKADPKPVPALEKSALRVERGDQMRAWPGKRSLNAGLPRVVTEMDSGFD